MLTGCAPRPEPAAGNSVKPWREIDDRSFYMGRPVTRPDDLSGVWEAPDGRGGAVGLHLVLNTTVPADSMVLAGTVQSWSHLEVGLYQRSGQTVEPGEENWFSDSPRGGSVRYENGWLAVSGKDYDLDVQRGAGDVWVGRFHREGFDARVTLRRPKMRSDSSSHWYVGTWLKGDRTFQSCLHVGLGAGGALVAWSDALSEFGCMRYGPNVQRAETTTEFYGELVKAHAEDRGELTIVFGAYSGWCCPVESEVSRGHANTMRVDWPMQPNHVAGQSVWRRVPGGSCVARAGR